ncbi:MAG: hypothetical protein DMD45_06825 [Gemmatimonadetes bacterium]|nr:MAG: hypothetical protein DMD45_06825 [Gemmatimonadota bacterium]
MRLTCLAFTLAVALAAARGAAPIKTIALSPTRLPDGLDNPEPVRDLFDSLLAGELAHAGVTVIPSTEAGAIWKRLADSVHGFYSAITGERVEAKYRAVMDGTRRELADRFHADAWLRPRIEVVPVDFQDGKARWDGASEGMGRGSSGTAPALSLVVSVSDMSGTEIYSGRGGIRVLSKGSKNISRDKFFEDSKRNLQALHLAIDSLAARLRVSP